MVYTISFNSFVYILVLLLITEDMNHMDVFWKIAAGTKFDFKRFQSDAAKLKVSV